MIYRPPNIDYDKLEFGDIVEHSDCDLRFISNKNNMFYFEIFKVITNDPLFGKNTRLLVFDSYYKKAKDQDIINE